MKVTVDTNVLVRAVAGDHAEQARTAAKLLRDAEVIVVSSLTLCELAWVLRSVCKLDRSVRASAIRKLVGAANVVVDRPATDAGLAVLEAGGDFADGVIAYEGAWLGAETFVSFDRQAVALVAQQGFATQLLES